MKGDLAAKIHRGIYGKSDKANAHENKNPDFRAGYAAGLSMKPSDTITTAIPREWIRRGEPEIDTPEFTAFREWKRGLCASRMQRTCANLPETKQKKP